MIRKVMVTGGAGYKGAVLVPKLLKKGYEVVAYDLMLLGSHGLIPQKGLTICHADLRDTEKYRQAVQGCDAVIHMACISNDPSYELNPNLSKTMNFDCFEPMLLASQEAGVQRFINVSSSSVYGVSESPEVTEEHPLIPLTDYSKYKGMCEEVLHKQAKLGMTYVNMRPATVCGYSPRLRLDLTVNILTNHAYNNYRFWRGSKTSQYSYRRCDGPLCSNVRISC
jgi:nucleoside-diphosphate-sugar epimerase